MTAPDDHEPAPGGGSGDDESPSETPSETPESPPEPLEQELRRIAPTLPERLEAQADDVEEGVARLVLTLVELIRQILEHQAVRRMEGGRLSEDEVEELGLALLRLQERLEEIKLAFGVEDEDLNIDLGPLGRLL